jgi:hypothetical protein
LLAYNKDIIIIYSSFFFPLFFFIYKIEKMTEVCPMSPASSIASRRRYRFATEVVTVDSPDDPHNAASVPIYQTATFKQKGANATGEYDYSRSGNPTRTHVGKYHFHIWYIFITRN